MRQCSRWPRALLRWSAPKEREVAEGIISLNLPDWPAAVGLDVNAQTERNKQRVGRPLRRKTMAHDDGFERSSCLLGRSHTCKQIEGKGDEQFDSTWLSRWRPMHLPHKCKRQPDKRETHQPAQVTDQPETRIVGSPGNLHHRAGAARRPFGQ